MEFGSYSRGGLLRSDVDEVIAHSKYLLDFLRSANILIAGGSGFVGTWLISTLLEANAVYNLDLRIVAVSRSKEKFVDRIMPRPGDALSIVESDLENLHPQLLHAPLIGRDLFTHIIHGGNSTKALPQDANPALLFLNAEAGTRNLIEVAKSIGKQPSFIHLSSGAVYGKAARENNSLSESSPVIPQSIEEDLYAAIKIRNEELVVEATDDGFILGANPRLFAFHGPLLPLDEHFAIGNFVSSAIRREPIEIVGNANTTRSYLYPTDLIEWLLAILIRPTLDPIHIGSEHSLSMVEIAKLVSGEFGGEVKPAGDANVPPNHYVPSTVLTRKYLAVEQRVLMHEGLRRWHRWLS